MVLAGPAQADRLDCMNYLKSKGYVVGPKVVDACGQTEGGCLFALPQIKVKGPDAIEACYRINR